MESHDRRTQHGNSEVEGFPVLRTDVAGMDVGSEAH